MFDMKKVERVNELVREIQEREDELTRIFGGETPKRTWSRRPKNEQEGSPQ
jgi:hypothetical protein